jgi:hypothetical protein
VVRAAGGQRSVAPRTRTGGGFDARRSNPLGRLAALLGLARIVLPYPTRPALGHPRLVVGSGSSKRWCGAALRVEPDAITERIVRLRYPGQECIADALAEILGVFVSINPHGEFGRILRRSIVDADGDLRGVIDERGLVAFEHPGEMSEECRGQLGFRCATHARDP